MKAVENSTFLSFRIENEMFAVSVSKVLEVLEKLKIIKVPDSPEHIQGIINFRGQIIPVFQARSKFGFTPAKPDDKFVIIILEIEADDENLIVGAMVDKVKDVVNINPKDIKPIPKMSFDGATRYIGGIIKIDGKYTLIMNADRVFSENELDKIIELKESEILRKKEAIKAKAEKEKAEKEKTQKEKAEKETKQKMENSKNDILNR